MRLLQLGLVVLVSVSVVEVMGALGGECQPPTPRTFLFQGSQESQESDLPNLLSSVIIGLGVALVLVIVIMTVVLVCTRKRYCSHHPFRLNSAFPSI